MGKIPQKYVKIILEAKKLGYKGSEALLNKVPPKHLAKMFVSTQNDKTLKSLADEYKRLGKTEKLKALMDECKKKNRKI